nr:hypothetical protein CFP56_34786 [Quercus suber]
MTARRNGSSRKWQFEEMAVRGNGSSRKWNAYSQGKSAQILAPLYGDRPSSRIRRSLSEKVKNDSIDSQ